MSVWKRELFKWNRSVTAKESVTAHPLITLGNVDPNNSDLKYLHSAAIHGRRKDIIEVLQRGFWVDFPNDAGQTALFVATLRGQNRTVELLLQNGANPNERSNNGMTPVHVACLKASLRAMGAMVEAGGDLRLHDNEGRSCLDWASVHPDPRKRTKMVEFLQKSQLFALNYSGDFVGRANTLDRQPSILQMLRGKVSSQMSLDFGQETGLRRVHSHGYGRVYYGGETASGIVSVVPLVTENQLRNDSDGISFESSSRFTMNSMLWNMTAVTIKTLDKQLLRENSVDLLISEVENISRLRHPNLLLLMGLCQSSSFDNLMLVFERISIGSLYHIIYEKMDRLPMTYIRDIACQVCQAMLYVHGQNYLHCNLSTHAVFMVSMHQAKVGNLEYMMEMKKAFKGRTCLVATEPHVDQLYRWMAPEMMTGNHPPCIASDIYSFCCVVWEMITTELPWGSKTAGEVLEQHKSNNSQLLPPPKSVTLFQELMEQGLKPEPRDRPRDFVTLLRWLQGPLDKPLGWMANSWDRIKTLQKESMERISVRSDTVSLFDATTGATREQPSAVSQESNNSKTAISRDTASSLTLPPVLPTDGRPKLAAGERVASATLPSIALSMTESRADSDTTNNHYVTKKQRPGSATDSWSTLENSDDSIDLDAVDGGKSEEKENEGESGGQTFSFNNMRQAEALHPRKDILLLGRNLFERSSSHSTVSRLQKHSRRTASLSWQGSLGPLRAGNVSPRLPRTLRKTQGQAEYLDRSLMETSFKALPTVKPASHSIDVREFVKGDHLSASSLQTTFDTSSRKTSKLSPRRSLPSSRSRPLRFTHKAVSRSQSAVGDGNDSAMKDVELSVPGSVRTLTQQFQARMYNHSLRQSILKGSMTPHGTLFQDLDTSPTRLELSPEVSEIPPEGQKQDTSGSPDKNASTGSLKGSTDSLTSVSFRGESTQDEEDGRGFPLSSRNELDITDKVTVSKPSPVYKTPPAELQQEPPKIRASPPPSFIFQERGAFSMVTSKGARLEYDHTDSCPDPCIGFEHMLKFLPSSTTGTDVSNHPFDFQDYYIDDDYACVDEDDRKRFETQECEDGRVTHVADRSRPRTREHFWLGDNKRGRQHRKRKPYPGERDAESGGNDRASKELTVNEAHPCMKEERNEARHRYNKRPTERKKADQCCSGKEDQWLEDQWPKEKQPKIGHQQGDKDQETAWPANGSHTRDYDTDEQERAERDLEEQFKAKYQWPAERHGVEEVYRRARQKEDGRPADHTKGQREARDHMEGAEHWSKWEGNLVEKNEDTREEQRTREGENRRRHQQRSEDQFHQEGYGKEKQRTREGEDRRKQKQRNEDQFHQEDYRNEEQQRARQEEDRRRQAQRNEDQFYQEDYRNEERQSSREGEDRRRHQPGSEDQFHQEDYGKKDRRSLEHCYESEDPLLGSAEQHCDHEQNDDHGGRFGEDDDNDVFPEHGEEYTSKESSQSTVVERCVGQPWLQPGDVNNDDDDDNDKTLVEDDVAHQRRCIVLSLERTGLGQEGKLKHDCN